MRFSLGRRHSLRTRQLQNFLRPRRSAGPLLASPAECIHAVLTARIPSDFLTYWSAGIQLTTTQKSPVGSPPAGNLLFPCGLPYDAAEKPPSFGL